MIFWRLLYRFQRLLEFVGWPLQKPNMASLTGTLLWYLVAFVMKSVQMVVHLFTYLAQIGKHQVVPPPNNPIFFKSASRIAAEIREGKITSEHVVKCFIERIREVNPYINAVSEERYEEALEEARNVDQLIRSGTKSPQELAIEKPLLGVPYSAKILFSVKGLKCSAGSAVFKDVKAHEDALVNKQMKQAGAICLVTTNSPEFGLNIETYNLVYGLTRNPIDTRRTAGGSSGGESALISAAGSVLGLGNDLIGSLRFPAFCTGIFSHKPSNGIVSNTGIFPRANEEFAWFLCGGPMSRYAEDLVLCMKVLLDPRYGHVKIDSPVNFSSVKIYYIEDEGGNAGVPTVDRDILQAQMKVVNYFKDVYGARVEKVKIRGLRDSLRMCLSLEFLALTKSVKDTLYGEESDFSARNEILKWFIGKARASLVTLLEMSVLQSTLLKQERALKLKAELESQLAGILTENSVLLSPTFSKKAVYHYETFANALASGFTSFCNLLGLPASQCPLGFGEDGLPVGIQVIGAREHDYMTLAFAKEIEKAFGGWIPPGLDAAAKKKMEVL